MYQLTDAIGGEEFPWAGLIVWNKDLEDSIAGNDS